MASTTVCSETCAGRLRYTGLFLYDVDRVSAASVEDEQDLYEAQLDVPISPAPGPRRWSHTWADVVDGIDRRKPPHRGPGDARGAGDAVLCRPRSTR